MRDLFGAFLTWPYLTQAVAILSLAAVVLANDPYAAPYPAQPYKQPYKQDYYDDVSLKQPIIRIRQFLKSIILDGS